MTTEVQPLAEGKTKRVFLRSGNSHQVILESKDDITAGDGAKHDIMDGKAVLATRTTCNVFQLLRNCGIPVAFVEQNGPTRFIAEKCTMLPYEVVVRREAHGSYLKRRPDLAKSHLFPRLVLEFFLKTSGKRWKTYSLVCDDPLLHHDNDGERILLYDPKQPMFRSE
ncbi:MAG: phosphoribosylaminoimidazole carboxylase, partial [Parcubacteria group bacterium Gr01-1014_72]